MPYVNVDVHIDLSSFEDEDILKAAEEIIRDHVKEGARPDPLVAPLIESIRAVLLSCEDREPLSTAARLRDMSALRRFVEVESAGLFRFPSSHEESSDA